MKFDLIPVIRCRDCCWFCRHPIESTCIRHSVDLLTTPDGFCNLAELPDGTRVKDLEEIDVRDSDM